MNTPKMGLNFSGIPSDSWIGRAMRAPLTLLPTGLQVPVLQGPLRGKSWIVGASTHGCWLGSYEHAKQRLFLEHMRPDAVVYDVGANVGFYALLAAGIAGHVVAFEPVPRNLGYLRTHIRLNRADNVTVLDVALGAAPGTASFALVHDSSAGHVSDAGELAVRVTSIDALVECRVIPPPTIIKMDIEGGEAAALRGSHETLRRHKPTVFLATHSRDLHRECIDMLRSAAYCVLPVERGKPLADVDELIAVPE